MDVTAEATGLQRRKTAVLEAPQHVLRLDNTHLSYLIYGLTRIRAALQGRRSQA